MERSNSSASSKREDKTKQTRNAWSEDDARDSWCAEEENAMDTYCPPPPRDSWYAESDSEEKSDNEAKVNEILARVQLAQEHKREIEQLRAENLALKQEISEMRAMMQELLSQQRPAERKRKKENASTSSEDERRPDKTHRSEKDTPAAEPKRQEKAPRTEPAPPRAQKVPPIVLRGKDKWTEISKTLNSNRINYTKARLTSEGITVTPATDSDYKKMIATLKNRKEEYHTFTPPEDRLLRVVIKGIPGGIAETDIAEDLKEQGFAPAAVHRMKSRRTKQEMPLVLVQLPQAQTQILEVKRCCSLVVKVERQRRQQQATQCHRCQRYGHGQSRCTAQPKCVKCGEDHSTKECKKRREDPAKCANCQGDHPASYRGCPRFPKRKPDPERPLKTNTTDRRSYAQAAGASQTPSGQQEPNTNNGGDMETAKSMLAQFQQMLTAMRAFMDHIQPTPQVS